MCTDKKSFAVYEAYDSEFSGCPTTQLARELAKGDSPVMYVDGSRVWFTDVRHVPVLIKN